MKGKKASMGSVCEGEGERDRQVEGGIKCPLREALCTLSCPLAPSIIIA